MALPQLAADPVGRRGVRDRPGLDPVIYSFFTEIGADRDRRQCPEEIGILAFQPFPFAARFAFGAHGAELQPQSLFLKGDPGWRFCRAGARHGRQLPDTLGDRVGRGRSGSESWSG